MIRTYTRPLGAVQPVAKKGTRFAVLALVGSIGCSSLPAPPVAVPQPLTLDEAAWSDLAEKGTDLLVRLLQIDTSTPPIREGAAAQALVDFFRKEGLGAELVSHGGGRASVFLRIKSKAPIGPSLLLLSHLDAPVADGALWRADAGPFSGADLGGSLWGRGALEGKGLTVVQALAAVALVRSGLELPRDVLVVASAGGVGGEAFGLGQVIDAHPEVASAGLALTSGGGSFVDLLGDGRVAHGIANAERGEVRIEIAALSGPPGVPAPEARVVGAVDRALVQGARGTLTPQIRTLWQWSAHDQALPLQIAARSEVLTKLFLVEGWGKRELTRGLVQDELRLDRLEVGPDRARAILIGLLLPGHSPAALVAELRSATSELDVHVQIIEGHDASETPLDPIVIGELAGAIGGSALVVPILAAEPTDGRKLRAIGVPTYGFVPFRIDANALASLRGREEHVEKAQLQEGIRIMARLVLGLTHSMR